MAIYILECLKVKFLLLENFVVIGLFFRRLGVKLVLKYVNLFIKHLQLLKECTLAKRCLNLGLFFHINLARTIALPTRFLGHLLCVCLLSRNLLLSVFLIELPGHEVLIRV